MNNTTRMYDAKVNGWRINGAPVSSRPLSVMPDALGYDMALMHTRDVFLPENLQNLKPHTRVTRTAQVDAANMGEIGRVQVSHDSGTTKVTLHWIIEEIAFSPCESGATGGILGKIASGLRGLFGGGA